MADYWGDLFQCDYLLYISNLDSKNFSKSQFAFT